MYIYTFQVFAPSHNIDMVAIKNTQKLIVQLVFIIKQIKPEKCAENVYLAYHRKGKSFENWTDRCFYTRLWWFFFFREIYGDKVNITCCTLMIKPSLPTGKVLREQYIFSSLHKNCSEIVSVHEIMENKMNVMIGQRISRFGKSRQKQDFLPLYYNADFF